ncbi:MAG: WbqC family protein [Deltaproteobacteria bacterium]|nr:WbqC family protein [Deltaproteobacteria bacterium]
MRIAIHQPQFMPWLGYFDKMDKVDVFVLLDNVQFKKNEFQNRNKIKTANNWIWFTVPVNFSFGDTISGIRIDNRHDWQKKHLHAIQTNYGKAPFFKEHQPALEELYKNEYTLLSPLNVYTINLIKTLFSIETKIVMASSIPNLSQDPTERLLDICRYFNADTYLAGAGGKGYMECERFKNAGIKLLFQHFVHPEYKQLYGAFEPFMSAIDFIFNAGNNFDLVRGLNKKLEECY